MRLERNMTIDQLSSLCGISSRVLSDMENGLTKLPFTSFLRIIRAFSLNVGSTVLRKRERMSITYAKDHVSIAESDDGKTYVPLNPEIIGGHMTPFIVEIGCGLSWPDSSTEMTGEYFVYLLEGSVEASLSGNKYNLVPGDSLYFDTAVEYAITNTSDCKSRLLIVLD